jgi:hypothetical protein
MNTLTAGSAAPLQIGHTTIPFSLPTVEAKPEELVKPGKKGVTNAQMIPVLRATIDADDKAKMAILKRTFPQVYVSSIKYLCKDHKAKVDQWKAEGHNI